MTDDIGEDDTDEPAPNVDRDPRDLPVRFSALKLMGRSPAHYRHAIVTGYDSSLAMRLGTAAHAAALEPHRIVVYAPGEYTDDKGKVKAHAGKRAGAAWAQFNAAQRPDAVILTPKEHRIATTIAAALRSHDIAAPLLFGDDVIRERPILWTRDGRACSSLPDARIPGRMVVDLKTCRNAQPDKFLWDVIRNGYREQLRMYDEADAAELGEDVRTRPPIDLHIVAVESVAPYVVQVYTMEASAIMAADRTLAAWWERLRGCELNNHWPGYSQGAWPIVDDNDENNPGGIDYGADDEPDDEGEI